MIPRTGLSGVEQLLEKNKKIVRRIFPGFLLHSNKSEIIYEVDLMEGFDEKGNTTAVSSKFKRGSHHIVRNQQAVPDADFEKNTMIEVRNQA